MNAFRVHPERDQAIESENAEAAEAAEGAEAASVTKKLSPDDPALKLVQRKAQLLRPGVVKSLGAAGTILVTVGLASAVGMFESKSSPQKPNVTKQKLSKAPTPGGHGQEDTDDFFEFDDAEQQAAALTDQTGATVTSTAQRAAKWLVTGDEPPPPETLSGSLDQQLRDLQREEERRIRQRVAKSSLYVSFDDGTGQGFGAVGGANEVMGGVMRGGGTGQPQPPIVSAQAASQTAGYAGRMAPTSYVSRHRLQSPQSPHMVQALTYIKAALDTGINSDVPGPIKARVTHSVRDSISLSKVLIPQGSELHGSYDSGIVFGAMRVFACWHRLKLPNGKTIELDCMPAADMQGMAGLTHEVDEHWGRLVKATGLATVLSLGVQAATTSGGGVSDSPDLLQQAGVNAAREFNSGGQQIVKQTLQLKPTILVPPAFPVTVVVTKDLQLEPYVGRQQPWERKL